MPRPSHAITAEKRKLFKRFFESADGMAILAELKEFCFLEETTVSVSPAMKTVDPYMFMRNEGRRQVLLHIMKYALLDFETLERMKSINEREAIRDIEDALISDSGFAVANPAGV